MNSSGNEADSRRDSGRWLIGEDRGAGIQRFARPSFPPRVQSFEAR